MKEASLFQNPEFWVAVAFVTFFYFALPKIKKILYKILDERSAMIAEELAEARRLREEAQVALKAYKKKQEEASAEAEAILAATNKEAQNILKSAEMSANSMLDKRMKLAMEKIAQAEHLALQDVQNHIVDISVAVARTVIMDHLKVTGNHQVMQNVTMELERKLH